MKNIGYVYLISSLTVFCGQLDAAITPSERPRRYDDLIELTKVLNSGVNHMALDLLGRTEAKCAVDNCNLDALAHLAIRGVPFDADVLPSHCRRKYKGKISDADQRKMYNLVAYEEARRQRVDSLKLAFLAQ